MGRFRVAADGRLPIGDGPIVADRLDRHLAMCHSRSPGAFPFGEAIGPGDLL
jgi:hypothetical protein